MDENPGHMVLLKRKPSEREAAGERADGPNVVRAL
jgi:hypothetical protein